MGLETTHESAVAEAPAPNEQASVLTDPPAAHQAEQSHTHVPVNFRPRTQKHVTVFAAVVTALLLVVFLIVGYSHYRTSAGLEDEVRRAGQAPMAVDAVRVRCATPEKLFTLPGDARSFYETTLFARTNGYVSKWLVDIGDHVKEGDVLATIETPELDDQLNEAKAKLGQLQAEANVAATSAAFAKISFDRWAAAAPEGVVSAQERDQKKSELDSSIAKLAAAKSTVKLGEAQLQQLQTLEKFKNVVAPFEGDIAQRHVDIGALVTAGSTTNTSPLFTLSQSNQIRVFVDVPQPALPNIYVGMPAWAQARELPGQKFRGTVDRMAQSLDPHTRTMRVEVLVPNPDLSVNSTNLLFQYVAHEMARLLEPRGRLHPGMYLQVTFETTRTDPPLRIPPAAWTLGPRGPRVAVVGSDGRISFRSIKIGRDLGDSIEVESGLSEGEAVALNVGSQVAEGDRVDAHFIKSE